MSEILQNLVVDREGISDKSNSHLGYITRQMSWKKIDVIAGIISAVVGVGGLVYGMASNWKPPLAFSSTNDRFSCQLRSYPDEGSEIWTIMYRNDKGTQPWLRMVNTFGDDWTTQKRCDKIAERLEDFRKDGLIELTYRADPNTPRQSVICAKTKLSGENCELLVTLTLDANAYNSFKNMTEALRNGTTVDQGSNSGSASIPLSPSSPSVPLGNFLADEDLNAVSHTTK